MERTHIEMIGATASNTTYSHTIGNKFFELSNHLGNVLAVVTDKIIFAPEEIQAVDFNGEIVDFNFDNYASYFYAQGNCGALYPSTLLNNGQLQMNFLADVGCSQYNSLDFNYSTGDCPQNVTFSFDLEFITATKLLMQIRDGNSASLSVFYVQEGHVSFPISATTPNMRIKFFGRTDDPNIPAILNIDNLKIEFQSTPTCHGGGYIADIAKATDYSPFGVELYERGFTRDDFRFSFNGMEKDDEISGKGNSLNFGARMLSPRLGRWFCIDPLFAKYPNLSTYNFAANNPILFQDFDGEDFVVRNKGNQRKVTASLAVLFNGSSEAFSFNKGKLIIDESKIHGELTSEQTYLLDKFQDIALDKSIKVKIKTVKKGGNYTDVKSRYTEGNEIAKAVIVLNVSHPKVEKVLKDTENGYMYPGSQDKLIEAKMDGTLIFDNPIETMPSDDVKRALILTHEIGHISEDRSKNEFKTKKNDKKTVGFENIARKILKLNFRIGNTHGDNDNDGVYENKGVSTPSK